MPEHTILVAFTVEAGTRAEAHGRLGAALQCADTIDLSRSFNGITSYWVAEDDRQDGSDCDSAVFVHPGAQHKAASVLHAAGLTNNCNIVQYENPRWTEVTPS